MSERGSRRLLTLVIVWLVIIGLGAVAYKFIVDPWLNSRDLRRQFTTEYEQISRQARQRGIKPDPIPDNAAPDLIAQMVRDLKGRLTGSSPTADAGQTLVKLALDSFSGYSVLRSETFRDELALGNVTLELVDDGADYFKRMRALRDGTIPLAVITVDALIKTSATIGDTPATIVLIIDETTGADAMVAYKSAVPNLSALNRSDARIVTTRDSPSETMARVVMANFRLPKLPVDCWIDADGAADVYRQFRDADTSLPRAYVLWEPYLSKALERPGAHVVMDSSRFRGYIVDVLVAQRRYLLEHEQVVQHVVESYLRAAYEERRQGRGMVRLVMEDAAELGERLSEKQAQRLVEGIWWKSTQDNYAHLGFLEGAAAGGIQRLDQIIRNITSVLIRTGAIGADPTGGNPHTLFYDALLRQLHEANFHPALLSPFGSADDPDQIRPAVELPPLSDRQWDELVPIGALQVDRIVFARGTARLTEQSKLALGRLVQTLRSWPQYYLLVHGQARREGDPEANRLLAKQRAQAANRFITGQGIPPHRVRAVSAEPSDTGGQAQSVIFVLGQTPY